MNRKRPICAVFAGLTTFVFTAVVQLVLATGDYPDLKSGDRYIGSWTQVRDIVPPKNSIRVALQLAWLVCRYRSPAGGELA